MTTITNITTYQSIEKPSSAEFKDRGSKFIAYAYPIQNTEDVKNLLRHLKEEHPKAVHFCYAFRIGTDGNLFRAADDGEPSGSAGKPILGQIDSIAITNVLIVVVRYFGGTLLGLPGLINAYKTSAQMALQLSPIVKKSILIYYQLEFPYTIMNEVMRILKQYDVKIIKQEMNLFCVLNIGVATSNSEDVLDKIKKLRAVKISN